MVKKQELNDEGISVLFKLHKIGMALDQSDEKDRDGVFLMGQ